MNSTSTVSVTLRGAAVEEVNHFTYVGSVIDTQDGTEVNVKAMINRARWPFFKLRTYGNPKSFP